MAEVLIIGKPNVGKSTLFNRLVKKKKSIVDDVPGVTRDIVRDVVKVDEGKFYLVDTGGIFEKPPGELEEKVREKVLKKIEDADLILFLVDGRSEPTSEDFHIAEVLRKYAEKVLLVATKVENKEVFKRVLPEIYSLGFGEPIHVSAEHKKNIDLLLDEIVERLIEMEVDLEVVEEEEAAVKIAIVGKPNAGKSSLFNAILGEERAIVTPVPGTTRDYLDEIVEIDGKKYMFIDTAGLRRKSRIEPKTVEKYGSYRSVEAIERADVVVLVIDALEGVTRQDQRLAGLAERRGKATVVALNKWDLVESRDERLEEFRGEFFDKLYFIDYSPLVFTSAVKGWGIEDLMEAIDTAYESYTTKVPTSHVNRALEKFLMVSAPPSKKGKKVRIYFGMQVDIKPPTFLFFSNRPDEIPKSYVKSLQRMIRKEIYPFIGSPVFVRFKRSKK
jgi:GTP-binding protein